MINYLNLKEKAAETSEDSVDYDEVVFLARSVMAVSFGTMAMPLMTMRMLMSLVSMIMMIVILVWLGRMFWVCVFELDDFVIVELSEIGEILFVLLLHVL